MRKNIDLDSKNNTYVMLQSVTHKAIKIINICKEQIVRALLVDLLILYIVVLLDALWMHNLKPIYRLFLQDNILLGL